eukprot:Awhi_evm2s14381
MTSNIIKITLSILTFAGHLHSPLAASTGKSNIINDVTGSQTEFKCNTGVYTIPDATNYKNFLVENGCILRITNGHINNAKFVLNGGNVQITGPSDLTNSIIQANHGQYTTSQFVMIKPIPESGTPGNVTNVNAQVSGGSTITFDKYNLLHRNQVHATCNGGIILFDSYPLCSN